MAKQSSAPKNILTPDPEQDKIEQESYSEFPLVKINFILMAISAVAIILGFILISGGGSEDGKFNPEVFNATRTVIGPTITFLGFVAMGIAIMWPGKKNKSNTSETSDK